MDSSDDASNKKTMTSSEARGAIKCVSASMTYREIEALPEFRQLRGYFMECRPSTRERFLDTRVDDAVSASGSAEAVARIIRGLERARTIARTDEEFALRIWDEGACEEDSTKKGVRLFHFPATLQTDTATARAEDTPWVLVIPGGGYQSVCNAFEGFPIAAELNAAGYTAYVLSYRVRMDRLMPKPIDDVAQAIHFVKTKMKDCAEDEESPYAVMGFSAGAHLAAEWGTDNRGYRIYGLPKPAALVLCYAPIDVRVGVSPDGTRSAFVSSLIGDSGLSALDEFAVNLHMDDSYPDTYLWHCRDDDVVPFDNYEIMSERLNELEIPHEGRVFERGGHALMKPHDIAADRWLEGALPFLNKRLGGGIA